MERSLFQRAVGYSHKAVKIFMPQGRDAPVYADFIEHFPPDPTSMIFWLKNRQPDKWRDKRESGDDEGDAPAPVKIEVQVVDARKHAENGKIAK